MVAVTRSLVEQVADPAGLEAAWREVLRGDLGDGDLSSALRAFLGQLDANLAGLAEAIRAGYAFGDLTRVEIGDPADLRVLRLPSAADRVVETRLVDVLERWLDPWFGPASFAFRRGWGIPDATRWIAEQRGAGARWAARCDIRDCFDTVPHDAAFGLLDDQLPDRTLRPLLAALRRRCAAEFDAPAGLPQGCPTSPLLTNVALSGIDRMAWESGIRLARYADDMLVTARSEEEAVEHLDAIRVFVRQEGMELNEDKSQVMSFDAGFTFLGVEFVGGLPVVREEVEDGIRRALYVAGADRTVQASRGRIRVGRGDDDPLTIPQDHLSRIVCFGAVGLTAGVRQWALHSGRPVVFLTTHGRFVGSLQPARHDAVRTRKAQYARTADPAWQLPLAQRIVHGKLANQRALLQRFGDGSDPVVSEAATTLGSAVSLVDT